MNFQSIEDYITQFPIYQYAFLSIDDIEFNDKVRTICKRECPRYGKSWSCPPAVGTVDKCKERCQQYTHALLFSSVAEVPDYSNMDALLATKREHEEITAKIEAFLKQDAWRCYTLSTDSCSICDKCTYPKKSCNHPDLMHPCIESHGILLTKNIEDNNMDYYMGEIAIEGNQLYGICYNEPKDGGGYRFVTVDKKDLKKEPTTLLSFENAIIGRWTLGKSLMPCHDGVYVCLPFDTRIYKFKDATVTEEYNMDFGEKGLIEHPVTKDMNPRWFDKNYRDINWSIVNMTESDSILLFNTNKAHAFIMNKNQYKCSGYLNFDNDIFPIACARIIPSQGLSNGVVYFTIPSSIENMLEQVKKGNEPLTPAIKEIKQKFDPDGNPMLIVWDIK